MTEKPEIKKPKSLDEMEEGDVVMLRKRRLFGPRKREVPARFGKSTEGKAHFLMRYQNFIDRLRGVNTGIVRVDIQLSDLKIEEGVIMYNKDHRVYFPSNSLSSAYKHDFNAWYYTHTFYEVDLKKSGF